MTQPRSGASGPPETKQRWRIVFSRDGVAASNPPADVAAWHESFRRAGATVALSQGDAGRARISIGAAIPLGMPAEGELVDVVLAHRVTRHELRSGLERSLPPGYGLVDLFDVWVGAPALPAIVTAAEYRCLIAEPQAATPPGHPPLDVALAEVALLEAISGLLAADRLPGTRQKGDGRTIAYDLRPLILRLEGRVGGEPGQATPSLWMRLRHDQEGGIGHPDEVVHAIAARLDRRLEIRELVRERLLTADQRSSNE